MTKIDVEDGKPGTIIMNGLVGNCMELFTIRVDDAGEYHYAVRGLEVPVVIYRDALELASCDRFDPSNESEENGVVQEPD